MMDFRRATLETCAQATGLVVVIDVIRAFTTAAFAFESGASEIILVREVEEALALHQRMPGALVMGEVGGLPPEGFDYGNSPAALIGLDLTGRQLIQRTGAGTQGVVRSAQADVLLAASFVCAQATARFIRSFAPDAVMFVITGQRPLEYGAGYGDEDAACADYLEALLRGSNPDPAPYLERVRRSRDADEDARSFPGFAADLDCCLALDRMPFAMQVERHAGLPIMKPVLP